MADPMKRQQLRMPCSFEGCTYIGWAEVESAKERDEVLRTRTTWRCTRHTKDGLDVLSADRPTLTTTLTVVALEYGVFWSGDGYRNGFVLGPGFKAWAKDFPVGTRLTVTATIEAVTEQSAARASKQDAAEAADRVYHSDEIDPRQ